MKEITLKTNNLAIGFRLGGRERTTLNDHLSLALHAGELTCLLGPNGCGKSTLIRTLAGIQPPLDGDITIMDKPVSGLSAKTLAGLVSITLTDPVEAGNMTVYGMTAAGRMPYTGFLGKLSKSDHEKIDKALEATGISHLHHHRFDRLSDGEKQKVMIARSLAQETTLILLDEPTAFLDYPSKIEILLLLRKMAWKHRKTVLLTTHDLTLSLQFADMIWLMAHGKNPATGIPEDLVLQGKFGEYLGKSIAKFDITTGSFVFNTSNRVTLIVEGEGSKKIWLIKALERQGYQIAGMNSTSAGLTLIRVVDNENDIFEIIFSGSSTRVNSIGEVLELLGRLTKRDTESI